MFLRVACRPVETLPVETFTTCFYGYLSNEASDLTFRPFLRRPLEQTSAAAKCFYGSTVAPPRVGRPVETFSVAMHTRRNISGPECAVLLHPPPVETFSQARSSICSYVRVWGGGGQPRGHTLDFHSAGLTLTCTPVETFSVHVP